MAELKPGTTYFGRYAGIDPTSVTIQKGKRLEYCFRKADENWRCWNKSFVQTDKGLEAIFGVNHLKLEVEDGLTRLNFRERKITANALMTPLRPGWSDTRYFAECVQRQLNQLGFDTGKPDGRLGRKSKAAATDYLSDGREPKPENALENATAEAWCTTLAKANPVTQQMFEQTIEAIYWSKQAEPIRSRLRRSTFRGSWLKGYRYDIKFGRGKTNIPATVTVIDANVDRTKYVMPAIATVVGDRVQLRFTQFDRFDFLTYNLKTDTMTGISRYKGVERNPDIIARRQ